MLYIKHIDLTRLGTDSGAADFLRSAHATDPAIAKIFAKNSKRSMFSPKSAPTCMKRNVGELEIYQLSNFQLRTTLAGRQNVEKTKRKNFEKLQTLNVRLPPKQCSVWLQTLGKCVSDDPQHFIFRGRKHFSEAPTKFFG